MAKNSASNKSNKTGPIVLRKVRTLASKEVYWASNDWPTKEVDGQLFIAIKRKPDDNSTFWMKKDQVENA